jgi:hypothetical protein
MTVIVKRVLLSAAFESLYSDGGVPFGRERVAFDVNSNVKRTL